MNRQNSLKLLLVTAVAACCAATANAQSVITELTGTVEGAHGGWHVGGLLGQPVTIDFAYDASALSTSTQNNLLIESAPITSASIVGGAFGSGINLESDGPNSGDLVLKIDAVNNSVSLTAKTPTHAPNRDFTGSVFGFSFLATAGNNGITEALNIVKNVFLDGVRDARESGTAIVGNIAVGTGVQAPEIDPASAISALTLLMGSLAVMGGRKLKKAARV